jgi:outer membrane protein assembly factor BamA
VKAYNGFWMFLLLMALFSGCTGLRKISDGQYLYTGSEIKFDSAHEMKNKAVVEAELSDLIELQPNTRLLWMRPFLSLHNMFREPKKDHGFWFWLKYKLGEKPALLMEINPVTLDKAMENRLQNRGYFDAGVTHFVKQKRKTASLIFTAIPGQPYLLKSIEYPDGDRTVINEIHNMQKGSLLKPGEKYHLADFESERSRIDNRLKNKGYFYFSPEYLLFDADSAIGNRQIDVKIKLKPEISPEVSIPYRINNVYVFDDFSLTDYHPDTTLIDGFYYISSGHHFKPKTVLSAVFLQKDSLYSRFNHYNTLRFLMGLGIYKFTNARFSKTESEPGFMNINLLLTPVKKMSLSSEISAAIKSNNFAGPGLNYIFRNRNAFGGAELLTINLGGRFETQMGGDTKGQTNYEVTLDASLTLPKILPGGIVKKTSRQFVPKTIFTLGGGFFSRVDLYKFYSFNVSLGYNWKTNEKISHLYRPVDVSFTRLAESSPEFEDYLNENPNIRKSMEEQFILGTSYTFNLSNMHQVKRKSNFYLNETIDMAGNLATLLMSAASGEKPSPENPHKLLEVAYSQFVRLHNEFSYFRKVGKKSQIGWHIIAAAGIPYWNSSIIPYVKQFYVGGTNSIRAFPARSVGPGTYQTIDTLNTGYVDQTGDIKFETSLEYRFPIYKYFKGALFIDAGNIWLVNDDENRPGGKFDPDTFYTELAVGTGYGLRFDFSYVVLRFDMAFPMRKPWLPEGERWTFNSIDIGSSTWRKENIITNIAIGYPF